jgi:hypothetical protein
MITLNDLDKVGWVAPANRRDFFVFRADPNGTTMVYNRQFGVYKIHILGETPLGTGGDVYKGRLRSVEHLKEVMLDTGVVDTFDNT